MKVYVPRHPGKAKIDAGKVPLPGGFARSSGEGTRSGGLLAKRDEVCWSELLCSSAMPL